MVSKYFKAGILMALLVLPALFFIFLKSFGKNEFYLPYLLPELDRDGEVIVQKGDTLYHVISNFSLENDLGEPVSLSENSRKVRIVSFVFDNCDKKCPMSMSNLERVNETFKGDDMVYIYTIGTALDSLNDKTGWNYLNGSEDDISRIHQDFQILISGFPNDYVLHDHLVFLLDSGNFVRGIYDILDLEEVERLRLEVKVLKNILLNETETIS